MALTLSNDTFQEHLFSTWADLHQVPPPPLIHTGIPRVMPAEADAREHVKVTFGEDVVAERGTKMSRKQIIFDNLKKKVCVENDICLKPHHLTPNLHVINNLFNSWAPGRCGSNLEMW